MLQHYVFYRYKLLAFPNIKKIFLKKKNQLASRNSVPHEELLSNLGPDEEDVGQDSDSHDSISQTSN